MTLLAILGLVVLGSVEISSRIGQLEAEREGRLRTGVETAISIADFYDSQESTGNMSREEAQAATLNAVRAIRYNGNGYVFVTNFAAQVLTGC